MGGAGKAWAGPLVGGAGKEWAIAEGAFALGRKRHTGWKGSLISGTEKLLHPIRESELLALLGGQS